MKHIVMKHTVMVWSEPQEVIVHQKSKSVWIAVGSYLGKSIETKGATEGAALIRWREAAEYKGK